MTKNNLLKVLMELDFVAVDLQLYLDTHATDANALKYYNEIVAEAAEVRKEYERLAGPLMSFRCPQDIDHLWIEDPWPWQKSMNLEIVKGEY